MAVNTNTGNAVQQSLSTGAARQLATTTKTIPQMADITPRWFLRLLPWVQVDAGTYRVNRRKVVLSEERPVNGKLTGEQANVDAKDLRVPLDGVGEKNIQLSAAHVGEPDLPTTFVDYEENPREYGLSIVQTILRVHTRVSDIYNVPHDQLGQQLRLTIEAVKERQEWEMINNPDFGLLKNVTRPYSVRTRNGPPTPDDMDELLARVWKQPAFFLAHPRAIAAFGRECTRRGVPPPTVEIFGSPFLTWRGVPIIPTNKLMVSGGDITNILLMRVGEREQGVVGLHQTGIPDEHLPGLSVRFMGIDNKAIASYLVTAYYSVAALVDDALGVLENVEVSDYGD